MVKRRRSACEVPTDASTSDEKESYVAKLRPKNDLRQPDRWSYQASQERRKKVKGRAKFIAPYSDVYAANLHTWIRPPKFMETHANTKVRPRGSTALPVSFTNATLSELKSKAESPDDRHARIFRDLHPEIQFIMTSMFMDCAPVEFGIPKWFWGHLRPCDRFLLLKRIVVVELKCANAEILDAVERPDFANARKIVKNLQRLHVIISPDPVQTNAMRIPNICARLIEIHDSVRHPRKTRKLQDARHFSVAVDGHNHGRLNICLSGDGFLLKLWTDERDFSKFVGQYQREVFPSVRATFRAESTMEDALTLDADYLEAKRAAVRDACQSIMAP